MDKIKRTYGCKFIEFSYANWHRYSHFWVDFSYFTDVSNLEKLSGMDGKKDEYTGNSGQPEKKWQHI